MFRVRAGHEILFPERRVSELCATAGELYRETGGRRTLAFERDGHGFFIKCHRGAGWREIWKNLLSLRLPVVSARTEWRALRRLESLAVPATRWVVFGEEGRNPATRRSLLVTEALEGTRDLEYWAGEIKRYSDRAAAARAKWALITQVARLTRVLHENGVNHRDYYLCHLRMAATREGFFRDPGVRPIYVMDLHRAQLRRRTPLRWLAKDLEGLLFSCQYGPAGLALTSRDLIRFLRVYRDDWRSSLCRERRLWRRLVRRLCRSYRREVGGSLLLPPFLSGLFARGACSPGDKSESGLRLTDPSALPCRVPLAGALPMHGQLRCEVALRARPGKRLACSGHWGDRPVFVKLFAPGRSGARHWRREHRSLQRLQERGIAVPRLLYAGTATAGVHVLVCEYLPAARTLARLWQETTEPVARRALLTELITLFARHHEQGVLPMDPHLGNFARRPDGILTLDAGDLKLCGAGVRRLAALRNLGLLLAQFPRETEPVALALYGQYARARGWKARDRDRRRVGREIRGARRWRRRKYLQKVFRECSAVVHRQGWRGRVLCDRACYRGEMLELLANPDAYMEERRAQTLKAGHSSTVQRVGVDGQQLLVKRYHIKGWRHALSRALRATRAARSWCNAHALSFDGVPTARPLAMLERRLGPFRRQSYLVTEFVPGPTCSAYFSDTQGTHSPDDQALSRVSELLQRLEALHMVHGDMKATNIIMAPAGPLLVDLDALRCHRQPWLFRRADRRDRQRFLANWKALPAVEARFRAALGERERE